MKKTLKYFIFTSIISLLLVLLIGAITDPKGDSELVTMLVFILFIETQLILALLLKIVNNQPKQ
ncbi:hypothetical protein [Rossellomorea arthrocnemi]|uniref:hypothetical protein n=1 Tax=Rossellomorea arthrocnemi TaxID=2769542 RepID=UPI0019199D9A|nr:hypothetical protein [Rossellomorea arthrocnemi]